MTPDTLSPEWSFIGLCQGINPENRKGVGRLSPHLIPTIFNMPFSAAAIGLEILGMPLLYHISTPQNDVINQKNQVIVVTERKKNKGIDEGVLVSGRGLVSVEACLGRSRRDWCRQGVGKIVPCGVLPPCSRKACSQGYLNLNKPSY